MLLERARAIHDRAVVLDAHADIELPHAPSPYVGEDGLSQIAPAKLHAGGVDAVEADARRSVDDQVVQDDLVCGSGSHESEQSQARNPASHAAPTVGGSRGIGPA